MYNRKKELGMLGMTENDLTDDSIGLDAELNEAEEVDEASFAAIAPQGRFGTADLNLLVDAVNLILPAFEQSPDYPKFSEDVTVLPTDFVRVLSMVQGAVNEAVGQDKIDAEIDFTLEEITDGNALNLLAGKISQLAKNRDFKRFLSEPPVIEEMEEEMPEQEQMQSPEELDALFASRI